MEKNLLALYSGGLDSTVMLGMLKVKYPDYKIHPVFINYGQKHYIAESNAAKNICKLLGLELTIINLKETFKDIKMVSSLMDNNIDVNSSHSIHNSLPSVFVPNRNTFFITILHTLAQIRNGDIIAIGVCQEDDAGFPDCKLDFINKIISALNSGSGTDINIETPILNLTKANTFKQAYELESKYGLENFYSIVLNQSHTCYNGNEAINEWGKGCGECPNCKLRKAGYNQFILINKKEEV